MAQGDVAVGRDAKQAKSGAAGERLADAFVQLLERFLHVRESVVTPGHGRFEKLEREVAELTEHLVVSAVRNRVRALRRSRHRRESDLPEADLLGQVLIDALDVHLS